MFALMVFSNLSFLSYWIYYTFGYYLGKLYKNSKFCKRFMGGKLDNWANKVAPDFTNNENLKVTQSLDNDKYFEIKRT
jgi:hypothetical protein